MDVFQYHVFAKLIRDLVTANGHRL